MVRLIVELNIAMHGQACMSQAVHICAHNVYGPVGDTKGSGAISSSSTRKRASTVNYATLCGRHTVTPDRGGATTPSTRKRARSYELNGDTDDHKEPLEKSLDGVESQKGPPQGLISKAVTKSKGGGAATGSSKQPRKKQARTAAPARSNTGGAAIAESSMVSDPSEDAAAAVSQKGGASAADTPGNKNTKGAGPKRGKSKAGRAHDAATSSHVIDHEEGDGADDGAAAGPSSTRLGGVSADAIMSTAEEQWENLQGQQELLAIAPEDEVLAEILSLQSELAQVCNRLSHFLCILLWQAAHLILDRHTETSKYPLTQSSLQGTEKEERVSQETEKGLYAFFLCEVIRGTKPAIHGTWPQRSASDGRPPTHTACRGHCGELFGLDMDMHHLMRCVGPCCTFLTLPMDMPCLTCAGHCCKSSAVSPAVACSPAHSPRTAGARAEAGTSV
jgi:hypothetical protein